MRFEPTPIDGVVVVELDPITDERGWFARTFAAEEFEAAGLAPVGVHCNTSFNERAGTLRGMHLQVDPHAEAKLVRCTRGAMFDVAVDLRPGSPTQCDWFALTLTPDNGRMLYIAGGVAHGFQTLQKETEVAYWMSEAYVPEASGGVRWDDALFGIAWPEAPQGGRVISERDAAWPDYAG